MSDDWAYDRYDDDPDGFEEHLRELARDKRRELATPGAQIVIGFDRLLTAHYEVPDLPKAFGSWPIDLVGHGVGDGSTVDSFLDLMSVLWGSIDAVPAARRKQPADGWRRVSFTPGSDDESFSIRLDEAPLAVPRGTRRELLYFGSRSCLLSAVLGEDEPSLDADVDLGALPANQELRLSDAPEMFADGTWYVSFRERLEAMHAWRPLD